MTYTIAACTVKTPDEEQRNCPKHVDFYSKNKFEKLVPLVHFIIIILPGTVYDMLTSDLFKLLLQDYTEMD